MTSTPSPSVESTTSAQRCALTSLRRVPAIEQQPSDHRIDPSSIEGDLVGLDAAPTPPRPGACGEHGREVRDPEWLRLAAAAIGGGPPVVGEHPGRAFARAGLGGPASFARKARRGAGHQRHVVEFAAGKPGVQPPARRCCSSSTSSRSCPKAIAPAATTPSACAAGSPSGGDGMTGSTWY